MSLENLIGKTLERIDPSPQAIQRLLQAASASLADAAIPALSAEGKFDLAYKAVMQLANLALQANGYRTLNSQPGHHQLMIQALTSTVGLPSEKMLVLDRIRRQRNLNDYSGDRVSVSMATHALDCAKLLEVHVTQWLIKHKPHLVVR